MMQSVFTLSVLLGILGVPASAAEYKWIGQITEDGSALGYAIPESDAIKIDFHCDRKTKIIAVNYVYEPKSAADGMKFVLGLSLKGRDAATVIIPVVGERIELDDKFILQGETRMTPALRQVLTEEGILLITAGRVSEEIPLKGSASAARRLLASCP